MPSKTVAISTFGCKANQYDSAVLEGILSRDGWKLVDFQSIANAYIINTCTVTNRADAEARQLIRRAHRLNPEASIIVTGCYAQTDPQALAQMEGVSFVLGNNKKEAILDYLHQVKPLVPEVIVEDIFKEEAIFTSNFTSFSQHTRAFLKIQDGCNQMCSYCVIPFARGKNRSFPPDQVIQELKRLSLKGFSEAVLTGIHIGTYGYDLQPQSSLLDLMRRIEEKRPIHRVRLSSIDPEEVSWEMVDFLAQSKVFCEYLHIPLQSGDDQILKLMRRRYRAKDFLDLAFRLKEKIPQICLGTDIMAGFPYEDANRFEASFELVKDSPLDYLHVFPYAAKKKTRAASFLGQVNPAEKRERVQRLTELSRLKKESFYQNAVRSKVEVIVEEHAVPAMPGFSKGTSRNYLPVYVGEKIGRSYRPISVLIEKYEGGKLFGAMEPG